MDAAVGIDGVYVSFGIGTPDGCSYGIKVDVERSGFVSGIVRTLEIDFLGLDDIDLNIFGSFDLDGELHECIIIDLIVRIGIVVYHRAGIRLAGLDASGINSEGERPHAFEVFGRRAVGSPGTAFVLCIDDCLAVLSAPGGEASVGGEPVSEIVGGGRHPLEIRGVVLLAETEHYGIVRLGGSKAGEGAGAHACEEFFFGKVEEIAYLLTREKNRTDRIFCEFRAGDGDFPGLFLFGISRRGFLFVVIRGDDVLRFAASRQGEHDGGGEHKVKLFHFFGIGCLCF